MKKHYFNITVLIVVFALVLSACSSISNRAAENGALTASGTVSSRQVAVASEFGGRVAVIMVEEGQSVNMGDVLFGLDDALLQAQREQAKAAVHMSEAALDTAHALLESTQIQYDLSLQTVQQQEQENRMNTWQAEVPDEFDLPVWYFEKEEELTAAEKEVSKAKAYLGSELGNLDSVLANSSNTNLVAAEERLAEAQALFIVADQVLVLAEEAKDNKELKEQAQKQLDAAEAELNTAQEEYKRILTSTSSQEVLEIRARVAIARERYETALDLLNSLQTGNFSLQLKAARIAVDQAEASVAQAEAGLTQAQAALDTIDIQIDKLTVTSPIDGILLTRNLEVGEMVSPGSTLMTIGQLREVELIVYISEVRYGEINLGGIVEVQVDSFPGEIFKGTVAYISDQAEFTPRNVQTIEGRRATVYAVKILVPNPDLKLKPGMPADAVIKVQ